MVSVFIDQWFATRAIVGTFHSIRLLTVCWRSIKRYPDCGRYFLDFETLAGFDAEGVRLLLADRFGLRSNRYAGGLEALIGWTLDLWGDVAHWLGMSFLSVAMLRVLALITFWRTRPRELDVIGAGKLSRATSKNERKRPKDGDG